MKYKHILSLSIAVCMSISAFAKTINKALVPQTISYDGMPELEYKVSNKLVALDDESGNIRMKIKGREYTLKLEQGSTSIKRVYSNSYYRVTFFNIAFGKCSGEGGQYITGKLKIETTTEENTVAFNGFDALFSSKKCKDAGND
ncbi:hypothetical protein [Edaphocola flava]|uniref:hypothetical protein n=1 Tax=Edaphocola flava TaxID=2499629 RepID=UPI00100B38D1|nr:hypothetical protein [Edaphocola flava]